MVIGFELTSRLGRCLVPLGVIGECWCEGRVQVGRLGHCCAPCMRAHGSHSRLPGAAGCPMQIGIVRPVAHVVGGR